MGHANVLVVATTAVNGHVLRASAPELELPPEAQVRIVSPASRVSRMQWLTNEEDEARQQAERIADRTADAVGRSTDADVETEVGDVDPLQAAEDALAMFPADELVVLIRSEDRASWLERSAMNDGFERFGLPVRYVVVGDGPATSARAGP
jgi:hypothetical protein